MNRHHLLLQMQISLLKCKLYTILLTLQSKPRKRRPKRIRTRKRILRREELDISNNLLKELAVEEPSDYKNIIRITDTQFEELLLLVAPSIQSKNTVFRQAIPAKVKLEITLRYLAGGESFRSLSTRFRVPVPSISLFLPEVLSAITAALSSHLKIPRTAEEWKTIAQQFNTQWNFPRCCGAIDRKHIEIERPPKTGAEFNNNKGTSSVVLLALVDADYCFTYVNIGANGRAGDASVFDDSSLAVGLENDTLELPPDHVIVGDSEFPLEPYLMKPYSYNSTQLPEKIFNYRLSRAHNKVENAFGILASRFRIFLRPIDVKLSTVDKIIWTACSLHNWLRRTCGINYLGSSSVDRENLETGKIIPGSWRNVTEGLISVRNLTSNFYTKEGECVRETYATYFMDEGVVPWQWSRVGLSEAPLEDELAARLEEAVDNDLDELSGDLATRNNFCNDANLGNVI